MIRIRTTIATTGAASKPRAGSTSAVVGCLRQSNSPLGADTAKCADAIDAFDPDSTWEPTVDAEPTPQLRPAIEEVGEEPR